MLKPIGNIPLAEFEERYYARKNNRLWPRDLNKMASCELHAFKVAFGREVVGDIGVNRG